MKAPFVILLVIIIALPLFLIIGNGALQKPNSTPVTTPTPTVADPTAPADAVSATKVKLSTSMGDITLDLYPDAAPLAVQNFVTLGKRGYYTGTIFHRVIKDFMIQGGDPTGTGTGGASIYGTYFKTEINDKQFDAGALGVARTSAMNTNGSQFFITAVAYSSLNGSYTVMGHTADQASLDIVTKIDAVATDSSTDKPLQDVKVTGFEILAQ